MYPSYQGQPWYGPTFQTCVLAAPTKATQDALVPQSGQKVGVEAKREENKRKKCICVPWLL